MFDTGKFIDYINNCVMDAVERGVNESAIYCGEWLRPCDEMPDDYDSVYVTLHRNTEDGGEFVGATAYHNENGWQWEDNLGATGYRVIAWTRLPPVCDWMDFEL